MSSTSVATEILRSVFLNSSRPKQLSEVTLILFWIIIPIAPLIGQTESFPMIVTSCNVFFLSQKSRNRPLVIEHQKLEADNQQEDELKAGRRSLTLALTNILELHAFRTAMTPVQASRTHDRRPWPVQLWRHARERRPGPRHCDGGRASVPSWSRCRPVRSRSRRGGKISHCWRTREAQLTRRGLIWDSLGPVDKKAGLAKQNVCRFAPLRN